MATLPAVAVSFTVWRVDTALTVAVKVALVEVAGTRTGPGAATFVLLLASATDTPPFGAAPDNVTLHASAREPVIEVLAQESEVSAGADVVPVPLRVTVALPALLCMTSWPLTEFAVLGLNWTIRTDCCPGFRVIADERPETEKPLPVTAADLIVSAAVPLAVSVTDLLTAVPTETFPKASAKVLGVSAAFDGCN